MRQRWLGPCDHSSTFCCCAHNIHPAPSPRGLAPAIPPPSDHDDDDSHPPPAPSTRRQKRPHAADIPRLNFVRPMPSLFPQRLQLISLRPPTMFPQLLQLNLSRLTTHGQPKGTFSSQEISSPSELKRTSSLMLHLSACLTPRTRLPKSMMVRTCQSQHVNMHTARIVRDLARSS